MTVQELISKLQEFEPETKVIFSHTDASDFNYRVEMCEEDISLDDDVDYDDEEYDDEEDDEEEGPQVVVFTLFLD
jgi:hypothetical protein